MHCITLTSAAAVAAAASTLAGLSWQGSRGSQRYVRGKLVNCYQIRRTVSIALTMNYVL